MLNTNPRTLNFRSSLITSLLVSLTAPAFAQDEAPAVEPPATDSATSSSTAESATDTQARALLQQCADVLRRSKSVSYKVRTFGTDSMESMSQKIDAEVSMLKEQSGLWLIRAKGSGQTRSGEEQTFDVAWRKETIEYLDFKEKKVMERRSREVRGGAYQISTGARISDLIASNPYQTLLASEKIELQDRQTIDGVDCDVILATTPAKRSKVRWYFGVEDHLPRKLEKIVDGEKISGMMVTELRDFVAHSEPAFGADAVRVEVPADFTIDRYQPVEQQDVAKTPTDDGKTGKAGSSDPATFTGIPGAKPDPAIIEPRKITILDDPMSEAPTAPAAAPEQPVVQMMPAFELTGPGGTKVTAESLKGTVTIIDFFGGWMPARTWQSTLKTTLGDLPNVKIYAADVREKSIESGAKILRDRGITWDHLHGADDLAKQLGVKVFPASVVVDKEGRIVEVFQNCRDAAVAERIKTKAQDANK